jgi:hypothetical protein
MTYGTWAVITSLYRACSLKTVASELAKYDVDLVAVQDVRWDKGGKNHISSQEGRIY